MNTIQHVTLVTGASRGIGAATARLLAQQGHAVVVNYVHDAAAAEQLVDGIVKDGGRAVAVQADVSVEADVLRLFGTIDEEFGALTGLVNNAGVVDVAARVDSMSVARITRIFAVNVLGSFLCAREAVRRMLPAKSGSIINMSSIAGLGGLGTLHYSTAKAGLLGFTRSMARDLGRYNIRVNAICPGAIDTPMSRRIPEPMIKGLLALTPLGRVGRPEDIAAAALYLASDDAAYVTGQALSPNGGVHIA